MRQGQVAQSVEQGTENPRVGGSIPSLATLIFFLVFGCQSDNCEKLCAQTSTALRDCLDSWPATWDDLDTSGRVAFQNTCTTQWGQNQSDLEARELEDALRQCDESITLLEEMDSDGSVCDQLRAAYIE
jgi:hypothetical protein